MDCKSCSHDDDHDDQQQQQQQPQQRRRQATSILDLFAVRPDHVPPPLHLPVFFGGRLGLTSVVNTGLVIFFFWYGFR
jgi:hypothetical protein